MRGRAWEVDIYPFSFSEFLAFHGTNIPDRLDRLTGRQAAAMDHHFARYLETGGFPEAQELDAPERRQLLQAYVDAVLLRDIIERHGVVNATALRQLARRLLGNPAGLFSIQKFFLDMKSQGIAVARETLHDLLAHIEDAFLVCTVPVATESEKRRNVNPRKCYPIDPGLIPVFDRSGRANLGHALETAVLVELLRRKAEVAYVRTADGYEVDFIARGLDGKSTLIQVSANVDDPATLSRELRALEAAQAEHPHCDLLLLSLESRTPFPQTGPRIRALSAWQWALERQ